MLIKQSVQKPAPIWFSALVLVSSLAFTPEASSANYEKPAEVLTYSGMVSAPLENQFNVLEFTVPSDSLAINAEANPLDEKAPSDFSLNSFSFSSTMQSVELIPEEEYLPMGVIPSKKDFTPGDIMSDFVFLNKDSMTLSQIESFINHKGESCVAEAMPCLKDFEGDIPYTPVNDKGICAEIPKSKKASAAEMIYIVSQACGINPQVLLVTIQKEQGLLEMSRPTNYMYRVAMGHNCPDSNTSACGNLGGGFWNQLYNGAEQKLWYGDERGPFTYLPLGEKISRPYHPNESCGSISFTIANRATASLYYYTPYVPNGPALANMTGLGNDCSSYGNRNFFRMFNEWFGDSRANS